MDFLIEMKDFIGKDLAVDDYVVIMRPNYREFVLGKILKFTPKMVTVSFREYGKMDTTNIVSTSMVKVDPDDALILKLKGNS